MEKHYTSLHTPLHLDELEQKIAKNQKGASPKTLSKLDVVLIVIGVITTIVLGVLIYLLYMQDSGGVSFL